MGIKKGPRSRAALKDSSKRPIVRNRPPLKPQLNKSRIISKQQTKMHFPWKKANGRRFKPLVKLFDRRGMAYGRRSIFRNGRHDEYLRLTFISRGIETREGVEKALLEFLFQCRNLRDWDSGGDNLVDVFGLIKGRVEWAANCSVDLVMQLFFTLLRARLNCPAGLRKNAGKVALRVDKVISYINGVDHLLTEYEIYKNLALPLHHAIRNLPKKAKMPPSGIPGAVFIQAITRSSN